MHALRGSTVASPNLSSPARALIVASNSKQARRLFSRSSAQQAVRFRSCTPTSFCCGACGVPVETPNTNLFSPAPPHPAHVRDRPLSANAAVLCRLCQLLGSWSDRCPARAATSDRASLPRRRRPPRRPSCCDRSPSLECAPSGWLSRCPAPKYNGMIVDFASKMLQADELGCFYAHNILGDVLTCGAYTKYPAVHAKWHDPRPEDGKAC